MKEETAEMLLYILLNVDTLLTCMLGSPLAVPTSAHTQMLKMLIARLAINSLYDAIIMIMC